MVRIFRVVRGVEVICGVMVVWVVEVVQRWSVLLRCSGWSGMVSE